jgi:hypothetical protein
LLPPAAKKQSLHCAKSISPKYSEAMPIPSSGVLH